MMLRVPAPSEPVPLAASPRRPDPFRYFVPRYGWYELVNHSASWTVWKWRLFQHMYIPLPEGYVVGDRIRTNATYALVNPRIKEQRYGVITNGSHSTQGPVMVRLDGQKDARAMTPNLFDVIK
jgi:hypothetical protein